VIAQENDEGRKSALELLALYHFKLPNFMQQMAPSVASTTQGLLLQKVVVSFLFFFFFWFILTSFFFLQFDDLDFGAFVSCLRIIVIYEVMFPVDGPSHFLMSIQKIIERIFQPDTVISLHFASLSFLTLLSRKMIW
jgi:hypothetical protein